MNQPETPNPSKEDGGVSLKKTVSSSGSCCLGCLFHPIMFLIVGGFLLLMSLPFLFMDMNYFDDWMERSVKAVSTSITTGCDYENCTNESSWKFDFIPWGEHLPGARGGQDKG